METSRHELSPGVWLDARRALFLAEQRVLCVADLHFGYHWAHRQSGQMMPLVPDDSAQRLGDLCRDYHPERLAILGDIIHAHVVSPQPQAELTEFLGRVCSLTRVELIAGNHDRAWIKAAGPELQWHSKLRVGNHLLTHGDVSEPESSSVIVMGHEHPAIHLGDGVKGAKFPCFVCGPGHIILPAFSRWAAGTDIRRNVFMSPIAREAHLNMAVAIMGQRLLRIPIASVQGK